MALPVAWIVASGCAKGDNFQGTGGSAGDGGETAGAAGSGASGGGGSGTGNTANMGGGGASTSSGGDTTTSTGTMTTSMPDPDCPAGLHECNGMCVGNTPATGCLQSVTCVACPTPMNGSAICTADGLCDVSCAVGYTKDAGGTNCVCASQCCTMADCPAGQTCSNGTCTGGGSGGAGGGGGSLPCSTDDDCTPLCFIFCSSMMKLPLGGSCSGGSCNCQCL